MGYFRKIPLFLISAHFEGEKCNFRVGKLRNYEYKNILPFFLSKIYFSGILFYFCAIFQWYQEPGRKKTWEVAKK